MCVDCGVLYRFICLEISVSSLARFGTSSELRQSQLKNCKSVESTETNIGSHCFVSIRGFKVYKSVESTETRIKRTESEKQKGFKVYKSVESTETLRTTDRFCT